MGSIYSFNVVSRRDVKGAVRAVGVSRTFAMDRRIAKELCAALGLSDEFAFLTAHDEATSILVPKDRLLSADIVPIRQWINREEIGPNADLSLEFGSLMRAKRDLKDDPESRLFLELN